MKATRILLFLSPLLYLMPALIDVQANVGLAVLNSLTRGIIGMFPANALMAMLCYTYAGQLGRDPWVWVATSMRWPFLAPFILAFMPAKYGSAADSQRRSRPREVPTKAAVGPFENRFPLLTAFLANQPPTVGAEPRARFETVPANFEFSTWVESSSLSGLLAGAGTRQLSVWTLADDSGYRALGAGMVPFAQLEPVTDWLKQAAPKRKVGVAFHPAEGPTKYFEYYPSGE
jgi:hypothetical protein